MMDGAIRDTANAMVVQFRRADMNCCGTSR